jgi:hypothetical protein
VRLRAAHGQTVRTRSIRLEITMPIETPPQPLMTPTEVARLLNVTTKTLREWRLSQPRRGPESVKLGDGKSAAVRYRRESVAAWLEARTK